MLKKQTVTAAFLATIFSGALAGCFATPNALSSDSPVSTSKTGSAKHSKSTDAETDTNTDSTIPAGLLADAITAIDTALSEEATSVAKDLDFAEDTRVWSITVANVATGSETGLILATDGTSVLSTDVGEKLDADDAALIAKVKFHLKEALNAVPEHLRGYLEEAELENLNNTPMWKLSVIPEGERLPRRLLIDATNGSIN